MFFQGKALKTSKKFRKKIKKLSGKPGVKPGNPQKSKKSFTKKLKKVQVFL